MIKSRQKYLGRVAIRLRGREVSRWKLIENCWVPFLSFFLLFLVLDSIFEKCTKELGEKDCIV